MNANRGYKLGGRTSAGSILIGGTCSLPGAFSPNTGLPLTQFAKVKIGAAGFFIPGWSLEHAWFLYSFKCAIYEGVFTYRTKVHSIEILKFEVGHNGHEDFPYDNYPIVFEGVNFESVLISSDEQQKIVSLNQKGVSPFENKDYENLAMPRHQFGGIPYMLAAVEDRVCPVCKAQMPLIASIGNESFSSNEGFFGNDFVQVIFWACGPCGILTALNFAD